MSDAGDLTEFLRRIFEQRGENDKAAQYIKTAPRILGLLSSSRPSGNTNLLAKAVMSRLSDTALVDLNSCAIAPYDPEAATIWTLHTARSDIRQRRALTYLSNETYMSHAKTPSPHHQRRAHSGSL